MNKVEIIVDGKKIMVTPGANLLEEAIINGIDIPHLCYDPRLEPFGSCRLCFVEVSGRKEPVPACSLKVAEGMAVKTSSDAIRQLRKAALELLMAEHCGDCVAPCQRACPADIDIQGFIAHLGNGRPQQAAELIREKMPLPSICGRVCPRFCEDKCRGHLLDTPVDICGLKRYSGDVWLAELSKHAPKPGKDTGYSIAVVGGGPAGLTAAYYLALKGHRVTLYDAGPKLGGMLRYGIPEYRLPKELLDREIKVITDLCHQVRLGQELGKDFTLDDLRRQYDAVFIGVGCQQATEMDVDSNLPGIYTGIEFLRAVASGNPPQLGDRVAVVGGGNTAMDAARTALRLGAKEVLVIYRRSREQMPAEPSEVQEAEEEGVKFHFLTNPKVFLGQDRVEAVECVRMELGEPDSSGRRRPVAVAGSELVLPVDNVILAIGQRVDTAMAEKLGLPLSRWGTFATCPQTFATALPGVYAAGDCVSGAATVVEAVGTGRQAAISIHHYLQGQQPPKTKPFIVSRGELADLDPREFAGRHREKRVEPQHLPAEERVKGFAEYAQGLTAQQSRTEASRCLECGCQDANQCTLRDLATQYGIDPGLFGVGDKRYTVNKSHPYIYHDPDKCILCGKCVQLCQDVVGVSALGFVNRGYDTVVKPALDRPLADVCISCGQCVYACPTGALTLNLPWVKRGPWPVDRVVETTCVKCDINCALHLHLAQGNLIKATSPLRHPVSLGGLCRKGSFDYQQVFSRERLDSPLVKTADGWRQVSWEKAFKTAAAKLRQLVEQHGPDSVAVLASPALTNEESYLAQKLARQGLGTNQVCSTRPVAVTTLPELVAPDNTRITLQDVADSDFVLVLNTDLQDDFLILAQRVRQAVKKGGHLVIIGEGPTGLDHVASARVRLGTGQLLKAMQALLRRNKLTREQTAPMGEGEIRVLAECQHSRDAVIKVLNQFLAASKPVIIADGEKLTEAECRTLQDIVRVTGNAVPGQGLLLVHQGGNTRGQLYTGVSPQLLPGLRPLAGAISRGELMEKLQSGQVRGLVVIGADFDWTAAAKAFVVAVTATRPSLECAVVLPAALPEESEGTVFNCEGRLQRVAATFAPPGGKRNWEILAELGQALGMTVSQDLLAEFLGEAGWQVQNGFVTVSK